MEHRAEAAIRSLAILVLLVGGAGRAHAGPTLESRPIRPNPKFLAVVNVLGLGPDHRSNGLRIRDPDLIDTILSQTLGDQGMDLEAEEDRFPPLYSRGLILGSLIAAKAGISDSPLNSQGLTIAAILNAAPTGPPSVGRVGLNLFFGGSWTLVNASVGGSSSSGLGNRSPTTDNWPSPFDMGRARESAVLFLALVFVLVPTILALFGVGERDRWILLSIKLLSLFVIQVFVCVYSYNHYHPAWHPIVEALMLINLAAGLGCLGAGACAREQFAS